MAYGRIRWLIAHGKWKEHTLYLPYAMNYKLSARPTINLSLYPKSGLLHDYGSNFQHCSWTEIIAVFLYE